MPPSPATHRPRPWRRALLAGLAVVVAAPSSARAQPAEPPAAGPVSAADDAALPAGPLPPPPAQAEARALFREGNAQLRDSYYLVAVRRYQEALALWDHPAIHYNLAVALIQLDRPVEVYHHLQKALASGPALLGDQADNARRFLTLIERQVVQVEVTVDHPGGRLSLDGKEVFVGPGTWRSMIPAGAHDLRAEADGRATVQRREYMQGGETIRLEMKLYAVSDPTWFVRRPLPRWVPPVVVLGGVMALGIGAGNHVGARNTSADYQDLLAACLPMDRGCGTRPELLGKRLGAASQYNLAFAMYGAGTVAVGLGVILWHHSRLRTYRTRYVARAPALTPFVGRDLAGVSARGTF